MLSIILYCILDIRSIYVAFTSILDRLSILRVASLMPGGVSFLQPIHSSKKIPLNRAEKCR